MSVFKMPDGVEINLIMYVTGIVQEEETDITIIISDLTAFSDDIKSSIDLQHIIKSHNLDTLGTDWRVMTREEIADYKKKEREDN
jgi:hypothetical protein